MSEFHIISTSAPPPPAVPTSFLTDNGSTATPFANILRVFTPGNGLQGIATSAITSVNPNDTLLITLTDTTLRGTAQTVNAGTANINVNIPLATSNSSVNVRANIVGYAKGAGLALGGEIIGVVSNVGAVLTVIQVPEITKNNSSLLTSWSATLITSGTNVLVQVTGVLGYTINWTAIIDSVTATEAQA